MLANRGPKSVPGTRCGARSNASKQGAQIGARHPVRSQVIVRQPGTVPEFLSHKPPLKPNNVPITIMLGSGTAVGRGAVATGLFGNEFC